MIFVTVGKCKFKMFYKSLKLPLRFYQLNINIYNFLILFYTQENINFFLFQHVYLI